MMPKKATISRVVSILLLQILLCHHTSASHRFISSKPENKAILEELRNLGVEVFDDHLVTADGSIFPKIEWSSHFEKKLSLLLHDPIKVKAIITSYTENLHDLLSPYPHLDAKFKAWLLDHAYYLGSRQHQGISLLQDHAQLFREILTTLGELAPLWEQFFSDIHTAEADATIATQQPPNTTTPPKLTIITTSGGGGHYTVAAAMQELLHSKSHYQINLIDFAKLQFQCDALWIATGKYTGDMIYNQIFQQEHDTTKTNLYWSLYEVLEDYIPYRCHRLLKDQIKESQADLMITTMPHEDRHIDLAYSLDIPLRVVATDYQLAYSQFRNTLHASSSLIRYWLPTDDREIFAGLASTPAHSALAELRRGRVEAYVQGRGSFAAMNQDDPIFELLGFPVRLSFGETSHHKLEHEIDLRQQLAINDDEQVVILSMGRQGVGVLLELVKDLQEYSGEWPAPLHIAVVCGKNKSMQQAIHSYLEDQPHTHQSLRFTVLGHLNEQSMANYFRLARSLISKPGGATTAEASAMNLPVLICHAHQWEECNKSYLLRHGLGASLNQQLPVAPQLCSFLKENYKERSTFRPVAWQDKLLAYLKVHFA